MAVTDDAIRPFYLDSSSGDMDIFTNEITFPDCQLPPRVRNLTVSRSPDGSELTFHWTNAGLVFSYLIFEDDRPNGEFEGIAGGGFSGAVGVTIPAPAGTRYYKVAGQNGCGVGPF
jgi:hypothetical protein